MRLIMYYTDISTSKMFRFFYGGEFAGMRNRLLAGKRCTIGVGKLICINVVS